MTSEGRRTRASSKSLSASGTVRCNARIQYCKLGARELSTDLSHRMLVCTNREPGSLWVPEDVGTDFDFNSTWSIVGFGSPGICSLILFLHAAGCNPM